MSNMSLLSRCVAAAAVLAAGVSAAGVVASPAVAGDRLGERVYEMVSPIEKAGNQAGTTNYNLAAYSRPSTDGNAIVYVGSGPMGESVRGLQFYTLGQRTANGWSARAAIPGPEPGIAIVALAQGTRNVLISEDAKRVAFRTAGRMLAEMPEADINHDGGSQGAYVTTADGPIQWLTRPVSASAAPRPPLLGQQNASSLAGGSPDLSTIFFTYCGTLVDADAPRQGRENWGFYVRENGQVRNAGVLPDGTIDPDGAQQAGAPALIGCRPADSSSAEPSANIHLVSADGTRATFFSPALQPYPAVRRSQLYQYRKGQASVLVTRSEVTGQPSVFGAIAAAGSSSGRYLVFRSTERLTVDAPQTAGTMRFYRFDTQTEDLVWLQGLDGVTAGPLEPGVDPDSVEAAGRPLAVLDDGAVLFEFMTPPHPKSLTLWRDGQLLPIGTLEGGIAERVSMHVSSDLSTIVFQSQSGFVGGATTHQPGSYEVYRYVMGQSGPPSCLSCVAPGQTPAGSAFINPRAGDGQIWGGLTLKEVRNMSPDGKRVYFETQNGLVPRDTNGKRDVYEWADGTLSLISTGQSTRDAMLIDTSVSGDNVFFATTEAIDPRDVDGVYDVYDARVGGGFGRHEQVVCQGDGCQAPATFSSATAPPVSVSFVGGGNVDGGSVDKPSVSVPKSKSVTGSRATVRVTVPAAGAISWSGSGVLKGRRTAAKAASYSVGVGLTAQAKRTLVRRGTVKVTVRVVFTPRSGRSASTSVSVTFKRVKAKHAKKAGR